MLNCRMSGLLPEAHAELSIHLLEQALVDEITTEKVNRRQNRN